MGHFSRCLPCEMVVPLILVALLPLCQATRFFGPPAIGFGVGLVSVCRRFPVATSIVSRRSSRSYSHQTFFQATPVGTRATSTTTYTSSNHFYTAANLAYYQPNLYHYHSTPWRYRWGRSADHEARKRRAAKLVEIGDISQIPVKKISDVAANVSVAYDAQIWQNDMVFKDQDDCSKRLVCELNAMRRTGKVLSQNEEILADAFGKSDLDVGKDSLEFDIAAVLGREVGMRRCEMSYRRCETPIPQLVKMIETEIEELENIQKELENDAITVQDIGNRLAEEDEEVAALTRADLTRTTTTTLPTTTTTTTTTKQAKVIRFGW